MSLMKHREKVVWSSVLGFEFQSQSLDQQLDPQNGWLNATRVGWLRWLVSHTSGVYLIYLVCTVVVGDIAMEMYIHVWFGIHPNWMSTTNESWGNQTPKNATFVECFELLVTFPNFQECLIAFEDLWRGSQGWWMTLRIYYVSYRVIGSEFETTEKWTLKWGNIVGII